MGTEKKPLRYLPTNMLLAALAVLLAGCPKQAQQPQQQQQQPPSVTVSRPITREVTDYYEFPGETWAVGEVEVRARVSGYIVRVNFHDGQEVKAGDLLFEIDPRPYKATLDRANAELMRAKALLAKFQAKLKREERLRPTGAISEEDYEDDVAQVGVAEASVQASEAAVRDAELNLEFTRVVSPITGQVSRARVTEGNLVQPGAGEAMVLTTVVTINPIYVYFNVEQPLYTQYKEFVRRPGEPIAPDRIKSLNIPVEIGLASEKGFPHRGVLDFVDNEVNTSTGTIRVRGIFDNSKRQLTPGLYVNVRLPFGKPHPALMIADQAVGTNQRQKFLMVVNKKNVAEYRPVELGPLRDGFRVIESGITADDRVIVNGLMRARPGTVVAPHFANEGKGKPPSLADSANPAQGHSAPAKN